MLEAFLIIFIIQVTFFAWANFFKTDKVTDLSYGLTFIILAVYLMLRGGPTSLLLLPILWGLRLSSYLFIRILKIKKDQRFDGVREKFWPFAKFWLLQAVSILIISLPFIFASLNNFYVQLNYVSILVFTTGLFFETIADWQKYQFKNKAHNKNKFIQTGLWRYSRHPNYFGEMLVWWGIYLASATNLQGWQHSAILSPLYIMALLLFVSGVPTLEKGYAKKYGNTWLEYKKNTSSIIPWFRF
jgi:steroid 5-alpha reductase family enzyme